MGDYGYDKENTRQIRLKLNKKTDADIIQHIEKLQNIQGYLKSLIRADIARTSPASADQGEQGEQE